MLLNDIGNQQYEVLIQEQLKALIVHLQHGRAGANHLQLEGLGLNEFVPECLVD